MMKVYILMTNDFDLDVFLSHEAAEAEMLKRYREMVKSNGWNPDVPSENYCAEHSRADVYANDDHFGWTICEKELDVCVAVKVEGGMVQEAIANAGVNLDVYDLDSQDFTDDGTETEADALEREYDELSKTPGWSYVW